MLWRETELIELVDDTEVTTAETAFADLAGVADVICAEKREPDRTEAAVQAPQNAQ